VALPVDSRPPRPASEPPASPASGPRRVRGSDAYRRVLEELTTVLSPAVGRRVLDEGLLAAGASPEEADTYDLRFALLETLPDGLGRVLRAPEAVHAVLASLEEALVSAHRPPRLGESGSLPGMLSAVVPGHGPDGNPGGEANGAAGLSRPSGSTVPAPPPTFTDLGALDAGGLRHRSPRSGPRAPAALSASPPPLRFPARRGSRRPAVPRFSSPVPPPGS